MLSRPVFKRGAVQVENKSEICSRRSNEVNHEAPEKRGNAHSHKQKLDPENFGLAVASMVVDLPQLSKPRTQEHRLSSSSGHATRASAFQAQFVVAPV